MQQRKNQRAQEQHYRDGRRQVKIAEGERKYTALQAEMDEIMELINQAQKRFMASYKEVHKIISDLPKKEGDSDDETTDEA